MNLRDILEPHLHHLNLLSRGTLATGNCLFLELTASNAKF